MTTPRRVSPLRIARVIRGWQQAELSYAARIVQPRLSRIERGLSTPTVDEAFRVLTALDMTAAELAALEAALELPAVEALTRRETSTTQ